MNSRIKDIWLAALRFGGFEQVEGNLKARRDDKGTIGYCCLGVLCVLHAKETGRQWEDGDYEFEYLGNSEVLPQEVMDWAGLNNSNPGPGRTQFPEGYGSLAELNDNGYTFKDIADIIEAEL